MAKPVFHIGDVVEQLQTDDLPFMVIEKPKFNGAFYRYKLESIEGSTYEGIPEYTMRKARPPGLSKYGAARSC